MGLGRDLTNQRNINTATLLRKNTQRSGRVLICACVPDTRSRGPDDIRVVADASKVACSAFGVGTGLGYAVVGADCRVRQLTNGARAGKRTYWDTRIDEGTHSRRRQRTRGKEERKASSRRLFDSNHSIIEECFCMYAERLGLGYPSSSPNARENAVRRWCLEVVGRVEFLPFDWLRRWASTRIMVLAGENAVVVARSSAQPTVSVLLLKSGIHRCQDALETCAR